MTTEKYVVTDEQDKRFQKKRWELENRWRKGSLDPEPTLAGLQLLIENDPVAAVQKNKILRLISGGENLILDAVDGTEILADAKDVFAGGIDSNFRNWGADEKGSATGKTPAQVYEMVKDGKFVQIFGSLNMDPKKLCFTQAQIKNFVKKHRNWPRTDGCATFFLFESKGNFFVALVYFPSDDKLRVHVRRFEYFFVWHAGRRPLVVVPQLA